jgi:hypothetical protein
MGGLQVLKNLRPSKLHVPLVGNRVPDKLFRHQGRLAQAAQFSGRVNPGDDESGKNLKVMDT